MISLVLKQLFDYKNPTIAVAEPTVDLIKKILYPRFCEIFDSAGIVYKLNKSDGTIIVDNIGTIIFISMTDDTRIIGFQSMFFHLDELDTLGKEQAELIWNKALGRNRQAPTWRNPERWVNVPKRLTPPLYNQMFTTSTPEGFQFLYHKFKKNPPKGYKLIKASTYDNPYLPKDYINNLKASYPPQLIDAYLNGEFVNLESGTVYPNYSPELNNTREVVKNDLETLHIGMDFNVNHMSAVIGVKRGVSLMALAEISDVRDTPAMIEEIKARYDNGRRIVIYPDASGRSSKSVDASKSDIGLLKDAGFMVSAPKKNPPVRNRIVGVNTMLCNANGHRRLLINSNTCPTLMDNLLEQAYDKIGNPVKTNNVDHMIDALGYLCHRLFGVDRPSSKVSRFRI